MKRIYLLILALMFPLLAESQQVINGESFEATTFLPTGWSQTTASINRWTRVNTSTFPTVSIAPYGIAFARFQARGVAAGTTQTIALPAADYRLRGTATPYVRFLMYRDSLSKTGDSISVYINTSNSLAGATLLGQVARYSRLAVPDTQITNGWYPYKFNIPAVFNGASNYIMIKAIGQAGYNIYLDSFRWVTYPKQCSGKPTGSSISASPAIICGGTGTSALTLSGSSITDNGISLVWQSATAITGPWTNTGATTATTTTGTITATRYYRCIVKCALSGLSDTTPTCTVTVVTKPRPTVVVTPANANYCSNGKPVQLVATGAATYSWNPATGLNTTVKDTVLASPAATTVYTVTGTDTSGCAGTGMATVSLRQPSIVTILATDTLLCSGDSLRLTAQTGGGGTTVQWGPSGETTASIFAKPTTNTQYTATVKNAFNCLSSASVNLHVIQHPYAFAGYSTKGLTYSFHDSSQHTQSVHWWFGDGNESTKKNPVYTYSYDSVYQVMLVAYNPPCGNDTFRFMVNQTMHTANITSGRLILFPNPATSWINISGTQTDDKIRIMNTIGQSVNVTLPRQVSASGTKINVQELAAGNYILEISGKNGIRRRMFSKKD